MIKKREFPHIHGVHGHFQYLIPDTWVKRAVPGNIAPGYYHVENLIELNCVGYQVVRALTVPSPHGSLHFGTDIPKIYSSIVTDAQSNASSFRRNSTGYCANPYTRRTPPARMSSVCCYVHKYYMRSVISFFDMLVRH